NVAKNFLTKREIASIDPDIGIVHAFDRADEALAIHVNGVQAARTRLHGEKGSVAIAIGEFLNHLRQAEISEAVAVIGEEHILAIEVWLDQTQPVCDGRTQSRINERDGPIVNISLHELQFAAALS